jgi:acetylornithine deacetylase/succinyl-diaminopimelate desuccinylase-like protein
VFHGFDAERLDLLGRLELPDEVEAKLEEHRPLTSAERKGVIEEVRACFAAVARDLASDALLGLYVEGQADLSVRDHDDVLEVLDVAVRATVTARRVALVLDSAQADDERAGALLERLEADWRDALRQTLASALEGTSLPAATRNAVRYALEWQFAALDHLGDLGDESFTVRVTLPGVLVGGNYAAVEGAQATWKFSGQALHGKDVVLRAVSVLEDGSGR